MADYDSRPYTYEHIGEVRGLLLAVASDLIRRAHEHDASKLVDPERSVFDEVTPRLRTLTYGSPEYKTSLAEMGPALEHHYAANDHHPEHFPPGEQHEVDVSVETDYHPSGDEFTVATADCDACEWTSRGDESDVRSAAWLHEREHHKPGGLHAMSLIQLIEMLCDWIAATRRHDDGDIRRSIEINAERFGYGAEIERLLLNTLEALGA